MGRQKDLFRTPSSSSCGMSTERRSAGCYPACASHGSAASESSQCFEYSIRSGLRWDYARARSHGPRRRVGRGRAVARRVRREREGGAGGAAHPARPPHVHRPRPRLPSLPAARAVPARGVTAAESNRFIGRARYPCVHGALNVFVPPLSPSRGEGPRAAASSGGRGRR